MLSERNKIILVDNNPDHLNALSSALFESKISCLPIQYDTFYDDPMCGIRLAFFDINLLDSITEEQMLATIVDAIPKYISAQNGPYGLVFWTNKKELIDRIKDFINERKLNVPPPFFIDVIDKDEFIAAPPRLLDKIKKVLDSPIFNVLIDYEELVLECAQLTINQYFNIIPSKDLWGESDSYIKNFGKTFSCIASKVLGFNHAKDNPDKAISHVLTETLRHHIEHHPKRNNWKKILKPLEEANRHEELIFPNGFRVGSLNTLFHIDLTNDDFFHRGAVIDIDKNILRREFGINFKDFSELIVSKKIKEGVNDNNFNRQSKLIAIEISAYCDFSQQNNRLNKYVFGVLTSKVTEKNSSRKKGDYAFHVGKFEISRQETDIFLNLNYVVNYSKNLKGFFKKTLFTLKPEIVNQIGNRYANHVSRIGITSF